MLNSETFASVIDGAKGSALEALPHMHNLLNARPDGFDSIEEAIEWQWVVIRLQVRDNVFYIPIQRKYKYYSKPQLCTCVYSINIQTYSERFQTLPMANST